MGEGEGRIYLLGASVAMWRSRSFEDEGSYSPHPEDLDVLTLPPWPGLALSWLD
jgi:hypothetical protein